MVPPYVSRTSDNIAQLRGSFDYLNQIQDQMERNYFSHVTDLFCAKRFYDLQM